ncbi:unnamed protein product [Arabidopsis lyrata]|nr:unnamed protein product [Arabidopsis lyrata]
MAAMTEKEAMVDPFLVEALQNPRHRLTSLVNFLSYPRFDFAFSLFGLI